MNETPERFRQLSDFAPMKEPAPASAPMTVMSEPQGLAAEVIGGLVFTGLDKILPFLKGDGERKKLVDATIQAIGEAVDEVAAASEAATTEVQAVAEQFIEIANANPQEFTPLNLRLMGLALNTAVNADRREAAGRNAQLRFLASQARAAADHLMKRDS